MNPRVRGTLCGVAAAVSYGTNPLGALPLYADGINTDTVLLHRYGLAVAVLALLLLAGRKSFAVSKRELTVLAPLGVLFGISSLTLFASFHYMDAGVASTLLFVYPVMVAVMMALFFKQRVTAATAVSILMSLAGIAMLCRGEGGMALDATGIALVMASSLSYAIYIVVVNRSSLRMLPVKLTFYVLLFAIAVVAAHALATGGPQAIQPLTTARMWAHALLLALLPTVASLLLMVVAVHDIGPTPTSVIGALEPLTAVAIGVLLFGEQFTMRLAVGIALILSSVTLIVAGSSVSAGKMATAIAHIGHAVARHGKTK